MPSIPIPPPPRRRALSWWQRQRAKHEPPQPQLVPPPPDPGQVVDVPVNPPLPTPPPPATSMSTRPTPSTSPAAPEPVRRRLGTTRVRVATSTPVQLLGTQVVRATVRNYGPGPAFLGGATMTRTSSRRLAPGEHELVEVQEPVFVITATNNPAVLEITGEEVRSS